MAHIDLPAHLPGILGPLTQYPNTGRRLSALAQELLRGESPLTPAEREMIAACVSRANECKFCTSSHLAVTRELWAREHREVPEQVVIGNATGLLSEKLQALIDLALAVQKGGKQVTPEHIRRCRAAGADDKAIHDSVQIGRAHV